MRFVFLLSLLLSVATAGQAQTVAIPEPAAAPRLANPAALTVARPDSGAVLLFNGWYLPRYEPRAGEADTTGALLSLFRKRRYAGWLYTIPFMGGMMLALPLSSTDRYGQAHVADEAISPPAGIALLAGTVAGFIVHATKFNKGHLQAVSQAYTAGQPVPARYRRELNNSHFAEAAYIREALRQQYQREQLMRSAPASSR